MWDLPQIALIQKARHALREGRLDEAFAIAARKDLSEWRQCQVLLEKLVDPLLERARKHFEAGRPEDALADVERAQEAGGNRPATAELREKVLSALDQDKRRKRAARRVAVSVEGHIEEGRLGEGARRLEEAPLSGESAADLGRRLARQRRQADEARARAARHLGEGELDAAIRAMTELLSVARGEPESRELLTALGRQGEAEIAKAFEDGRVERAAFLLDKLDTLDAPGPERSRWREVISLAAQGARAISAADWSRGRVLVGRLRKVVPLASWVAGVEESLAHIEEALRDLQAGPLGDYGSALQPGRAGGEPHAETLALGAAGQSPAPVRVPDAPDGAPRHVDRFLLWVEGVGTFLLLPTQRATVGRAGSSARPDVALAADIDGIHAEFLRVDHDYFLVPRGPTRVGGREVRRHLLADGDEIELGKRCRMTFRLPSKLSPTAVLELGPGLRLDGDVRTVIFLDGPVIFGSGSGCHVQLKSAGGRVLLSADKDGFRCRSSEPMVVDGKTLDKEAPIPVGAHVEAGPLTFTLTTTMPGGHP